MSYYNLVIINWILLAVKYNNSDLFCVMIANNCDAFITGKTLSSRENMLQKILEFSSW
jgi:hypothetical protein